MAKKILSIALALFVAMTMLTTMVFAATTVSYTVGTVSAKTGAEVSVPLNVVSSTNTEAVGCVVTYDKTNLTYVDTENTYGFAGGDIAITHNADAATVTIKVISAKPAYDGTLFTLKFTAASSISGTSVDAPITVAYLKNATLDGDLGKVAEADQTFTAGKVTIKVPHTAPVVTAAIAGEAIVGKTLTASATYTDNWDLTGTTAYAWFIDGAEVATGETYVVKAADYGKAITAKATVTVEADENTTGVGEATTAAVAYDATAKSAATVAIKSTVIAVGAPIEIETTTTKSINDGEVALTYAWTYEDGTALAGEPVNEATYTPVLADYQAGKKIKVTVTPKGANDTLAGDAVSATTTTETVAGNMQPVISDLKVMNGDAELVTPIVGDVLTVAYAWSDVAEVGGPAETETDASVITWTIGDEVVVADEYEVKAEDIGKAIKVTVDAVSTDATPNTNLGLDAEAVVKGNTLEATTAAVAKNPAYKPEVKNVAFSAKKLVVGKKYTVSYEYADGNAVEDASTFAILVADTEDAKAEDWKAIEGFTGTAADLGVKEFKFDKDQLKKFVKIEVTVLNKDEVTGAEAKVYSDVYEVKKASSGSAGLTGPNLAAGGSAPVAPVDPSTPDAPVVEVNKDAIVLTINSNAVSVFGEAVENDVAPIIRNDRTMLPARIVAESLGAEVAWDEATKTVTITKGETVIVIVIDSDKATVNGEEVALDSAAFIENDRTYTPVRFIAEALGATVGWDDATKTVTITPAVVADEK